MLWLYRLLFLPALLLSSPFYVRRMWRRGSYGENFRQRFGGTGALPAKTPGVKRIWLQAVSVGEMLAIAPLLQAWRREGGVEVYLTTTTSTLPRTHHWHWLFPLGLVGLQRTGLAAGAA
jgi:3-deoxy-D-manno-octulosonic-acid transferase